MKNLNWLVYHHDFNRDKLEKFNIFDHWKFDEYAKKHLKEIKNKEEFAERIKSELRYYFWSRTEYEVLIKKENNRVLMKPWIGRNEDVILDVTEEQDFNWSCFYDEMIKKYRDCDRWIKIDIYEQVMFKFDDFLDYVWSEREMKGEDYES